MAFMGTLALGCSWDELKFYGALARNLFEPSYDLHKVQTAGMLFRLCLPCSRPFPSAVSSGLPCPLSVHSLCGSPHCLQCCAQGCKPSTHRTCRSVACPALHAYVLQIPGPKGVRALGHLAQISRPDYHVQVCRPFSLTAAQTSMCNICVQRCNPSSLP
jgi:hypothetical protein